MKIAVLALIAATLGVGPSALDMCAASTSTEAGFACCKICKKGKACGDSCIAEWKDCHKGKGCACDG